MKNFFKKRYFFYQVLFSKLMINLIVNIGIISYSSLSQAQLQVYPTRIFLNQKISSSYLNLKNTTGVSQKYKVELKFYSMNKSGEYSEVVNSKTQKFSLKNYIKYSPHEVFLESNSQQTVRFMLVNIEKLTLPEYYVHFYFVPDNSKSSSQSTEINNFSLQGKVAIAIPVLFRNSEVKYNPDFEIKNSVLNKNGDLHIAAVLKNAKDNFFYGQIEFYQQKQSELKLLSVLKGVSSYTESKNLNINLNKNDFEDKKIVLARGDQLRIVLKNDSDDQIFFKKEFDHQISK